MPAVARLGAKEPEKGAGAGGARAYTVLAQLQIVLGLLCVLPCPGMSHRCCGRGKDQPSSASRPPSSPLWGEHGKGESDTQGTLKGAWLWRESYV